MPRRVASAGFLAAVVVAAAAFSCVGSIGEQDGNESSDGPGGGSGGRAAPFVPAPGGLRRLTLSEYRSSVSDLLGADVKIPTDLEVDTRLHGFSTVGASQLTISPRAAEQFETAARAVAHQVFAPESDLRRRALVGCAPTTAADPCIRAFLGAFGRRAWRRPLVGAELDSYVAVVAKVAGSFRDVWVGVEYAVAAMLQSPKFLFRVELGSPDPKDPSRLRYDDYELATRLSYFLWGTTPDDTLLAAAEMGALAFPAGIRAEAERLLESPRARDAVRAYFGEYFNLDRLDGLAKDVKTFPQLTPTLGASMRGEVERVVDDIAFGRDADYRDLFDTRETFVNAELAKLYGLPAPAGPGFSRVSFPDDGPRGGLLGFAGILSLYAHASVTSPTLRGKFVRQNLLCEDIPPPPPGVVTSLPEGPASAPKTVRERLEAHRSNPTCATCHRRMDPIGLGLEGFDALGVYRTTELGRPIDAKSDLDGAPFDGARALGAVLRAKPGIGACQVRRLYRYAVGHLETDGEEPLLATLSAGFEASGFRIKKLLVDVAMSDGFRYAGKNR